MFFKKKVEFRSHFNVVKAMMICSFFTACASSGNQQMADYDKGNLQKMVTTEIKTKTDALNKFGDPNDVDFNSNGQEKWTYSYQHRTSKVQNFIPVVNWFTAGTDDLNKKIILVFDKRGVVINAAVTESRGETKGGIAN